MLEKEIIDRASKIWWWHQIRLTPNYVTPGITNPVDMIAPSDAPSHVQGRRVLDIACWDGGLSFELERRGAAEVVGIDTWASKEQRAGFDLAHEVLASKVQGIQMDVMEATPENLGTFDVIFCCGLLYHLRHPLLALERIGELCRDLLVVETYLSQRPGRPVAEFYPGRELNNDPSNWWGPNVECVVAWLRSSGFKTVEFRGGASRGVFHARVG